MMTTTRMLYARASALPAIAAALALCSTPVLAQEAQPVPTEPAPVATPTPAPTVDAPPVAADPTATVSETPDAAATAETTTRTVKRTTHMTAKPAAVPTRTASRTVTTHTVAPAHPAVAAVPASPVAAPAPATGSRPAPIVDVNAKPATAPKTTSAAKPSSDETVPMVAGGALVLLALGAAAYAMKRRRRHDEDVWVEDEAIGHEPVETAVDEPVIHHEKAVIHEPEPAMIAPSAFAWGNDDHSAETQVADDDRRPGESWVERAYRGPSPGNPSVSLRARLKRAAFFDKREREVAAGTAEPVDTDAGLPEAMVEEQERELA